MSFLLFFLLGSSLAMRDEICKDQRNVLTVVGEEINLVSPVEKSVQTVEGKDINPVSKAAEARIQSLSFSNFVFTALGGHQCCLGSVCANYHQDVRCEVNEIVVTVDNNTCNLTIKNIDESNAGTYQSFDRDGKLIEGCKLTVEISEKWTIIGTIFGVIIGLVFTSCLCCVYVATRDFGGGEWHGNMGYIFIIGFISIVVGLILLVLIIVIIIVSIVYK